MFLKIIRTIRTLIRFLINKDFWQIIKIKFLFQDS
jgi:hypothetical protein